jgi:hypothetical protein
VALLPALPAFLFPFQGFEKALSFQFIDDCFINELAQVEIPHPILGDQLGGVAQTLSIHPRREGEFAGNIIIGRL